MGYTDLMPTLSNLKLVTQSGLPTVYTCCNSEYSKNIFKVAVTTETIWYVQNMTTIEITLLNALRYSFSMTADITLQSH